MRRKCEERKQTAAPGTGEPSQRENESVAICAKMTITSAPRETHRYVAGLCGDAVSAAVSGRPGD
jgi:hypothetical protein